MKKIFCILILLFVFSCSNKSFEVKRMGSENTETSEIIEQDGDGVIDYVEGEPNFEYNYDAVEVEEIGEAEEGGDRLETRHPIESTISLPIYLDTSYTETIISEEFFMIDDSGVGDINYVVDDTMLIGITTEVNMTISHFVDIETIIEEIETFTEENIHSEQIRIAPVMRAKLIDPTGINFRIISTTNDEQFLEDGDFTLWTWNVTPLLKGENELELVVDIIIDDKSKSIQVFDGVIHVYSDDSFFEIIFNFISKNWMFLLSSLIIPFFVFLYKMKYGKKDKDEKNNT